jgi:hypothetical protein
MSQAVYNAFREMSKVVDISNRVFPISVRSLREVFEKALRKSGIEDFHFHDLRPLRRDSSRAELTSTR